jgi:hypothetical protein
MSRIHQGSRRRILSLAAVLPFAAGAALALFAGIGSAVAAGSPTQLVYRVTHSVFGNIGTYINTIEPVGTGTMVMTSAHFEVKMLGVTMHREDARRTERWAGNRLVSFDGVTDKGSGPKEVKGVARGNSFVITSPLGTFSAPATVHPANPWSANFVGSSAMMRPDNGKVEPVRVTGGKPAAVTIDGAAVSTRKYEIDGHDRYTVWIDSRGIPVKFEAPDDTGTVTFTLAKCIRCGLDGVQLGEK